MGSQDLWEKAIQQLDPEDRDKIPSHQGQTVTLETVLSSAQEKQAECEKKSWKYKKRDGTRIELRQVFSRVVQRLSKFKAIGDSVAAIDPVHLSIPWAAISLVLKIATSESEYYQAVFEGIETFSGLVPRYALFERLYLRAGFPLQDNLEEALVKLYATALKYLIKANKYYAEGSIKRITKGIIQAYGFDGWMADIREQQRIADELARLIDAQANRHADDKLDSIKNEQSVLKESLKYFQQPIQFIKDGLVDLVNSFTKRDRENQENRVLKWLSTLSPSEFYRQRRDARLPGSGRWIFEEQDYIKWRLSSESAVLWLHGHAGSGKSTLMSTIIENLQADHEHAPGGVLAYVFCSRNRSDPRWQDPKTLVRCLIAQLARPMPSAPLRGEVIRAYEDTVQKEGDAAVAEGTGPLWNDAIQLLFQLVSQGTTTICIDAIDECSEDYLGDFLGLIDGLLTKTDGGRVKILISSRPSLNIAERFPSCHYVDAGQNGADIEAYARDKARDCVRQMRHAVADKEKLEEELKQHLVNGAQGMFLWVELKAQMLIRQARHVIFEGDLLQSSTTTLKPLDQLFQDIYDAIFANDLQKSRTCQTALIVFRWLLCARAVIPAEELVRAIAVYLDKSFIDLDTQSTNLTLSMVLDSCQDLVVVDKDTKEIRFIHTAVRDFLERKDHLQPTKQHAAVAELCLATVKNLASAPPPMDSVTHRDSFYYYVVLYWASHVSQVDQEHRTTSIRDSLDDLCQERPWFQSWLPQIKPASSIALKWNDPHKDKIMQALSSPATSFFTACAFGFIEVVNSCIRSRKELIRQTNDMGATGLHLAAEYGHLEIAEALCVAGADVQCLDNDGETPLVRAAAGGYKALVTMLLKAGASQQTHGRRYGTAMHGAALHGHLEVVEILLEHDGDVMAGASQFGTALQAACLRGHVKVVNLLLDAGADVNATGVVSDNKPPVKTVSGSAAAANILVIIEGELERRGLESRQNTSVSQKPPSPRARKEQALQLLLDQKVDVNILAEGFGPPLHTAARAGHDAVVNRLLRHPGVFVDLEGGEYGSALQAAAVAGSLSVVQGLLNAKADPNMQAGQYGTALIAACRQANIGLIELLLQSGAAVNIQAGVYGTALQAGCRGGNHLLVRRLLELGADVNLTGGDYCTALQAAARDGYEKIVQLLLEHGADVNVKGGTFGSALQAAAVGGHQQVVEMLFQAGAEVGDSLQSACLGGHQQLAEFFLARGSKPNSYGNNSTTALQAALAGQHKSLARWLLENGANAVGSRGKLGTALQLAAGLGDSELVHVCIRHGAEPMQINRDLDVETIRQLGFKLPASIKAMHSSAIVFAAAGGHSRVVEFLLTSEGGHNLPHALRAAVEAGQESIVNLLLSCNVPVDLETLMFAFVKSSPGLVASLLERKGRDASEMDKQLKPTYGLPTGASQEKNTFNFTDLETSIYSGSQEVVKMLFDYGANMTIDNEILFFAAVASGNSHIVRALLDRKVNVDFEHITHGTALQLAAYLGIETIVTVLLEHGANVNIVAGKYGTPVQAAAAGGHEIIVKQLISAGANVRSQGGRPYDWEGRETKSKWQRKGSIASTEEYKRLTEVFYVMDTIEPRREQSGVYGTALQAAAVSGNVNIVEMLVEAGADINDIDQLGLRPLHHAAFHGHKAVVGFLLAKGASGGALDYKGRSPMLLAAIRGHTETFAGLFKSSTESSPSPTFIWQQLLHTASRYGHIGIIEPLIAGRSNLEQPDARGQTPLLIASSNGRCSAVRFLIKKGSDINHRDLKQRSALYLAAASGHDDVVRLLLTYKADSLALDIEGQSALHSAALGGHTKVVYLLAEQKDLLDLEDKKRLTALYLAVQSKSRESVAILLGRGATPNPHTMPRPLDLLEQPPSKDDPLRDLLLQHGATGITSYVDDIRINLDDLGQEYESASSTDYYAHSTSERPIDEDDDERHEERESSIRIHSGRWHNVEERNNKIHSGRWIDEEEESNDSRYTRRRGEQRETKRWYVESSDDISDTDTSDATTSHESYRMKRGGSNRKGSGGDKKNNEKTNDGKGGDDKMNDRQGFKDILVFMKWWITMTMVMLTAILALMMVVMAMMVIIMMWTMFMKIQG